MAKLKGFYKIKEGSSEDLLHYRNYFFECLSQTPLPQAFKGQINDNYIPWDSTPHGHKAFKRFESDYKSFLIENKTSLEVVEAYLMEIYVNGIYKIRFQFESLANDVLTNCFNSDFSKAIENIYFYDLSNRVHGYGTLSSKLRGFINSTFNCELPLIDHKKYNISGVYFGEWTLLRKKSHNQGNKTTQSDKPSNNALGAFCRLIQETGVIDRSNFESNQAFVKAVFERFDLIRIFDLEKVPTRAWKVEFTLENKQSLKEAKEKIIPFLNGEDQQVIS